MTKKYLILSGSHRKGGTSDLLCDAFLQGASADTARADMDCTLGSFRGFGACLGGSKER